MKNISNVLAPECVQFSCFKTKIQVVFILVCSSCCFLCCRRIYQHSKTEFSCSLVTCSHLWLLFHPCFCPLQGSLCSPVQHKRCMLRKRPTACVSIRATPGGRLAGNSGSVCSAGAWDFGNLLPLCLILLKCKNLNSLFLSKLLFEGSVQGKRALFS